MKTLQTLKILIAAAFGFAFTMTVLVMPASAANTVWIYSPVQNKTWWYSNLDHTCDIGTNCARDVTRGTVWLSTDDARFSTTGYYAEGYVSTVRVNCPGYSNDNEVFVAVYAGGRTGQYIGTVGYTHLQYTSVTQGTWISSGTVVGRLQSTASACWGGIHIHMEKTDNGVWTDTGGTYVEQQYSTPVLKFTTGGPERPITPRAPTVGMD